MNDEFKVDRPFHRAWRGRFKKLRDGSESDAKDRVPRIARVMALALHCEQLIRDGVVADQSELARYGHISLSRMTQIMAMLNLATDIQEQILFLPGNTNVKERNVRVIAGTIDWEMQRSIWRALLNAITPHHEVS